MRPGGLLSLVLLLGACRYEGYATVVDGDTIRIGADRFRLVGIDAPELRQKCLDGWPAGQIAAGRLADMIGTAIVSCEGKGADKYGRILGRCWAAGRDLSAGMAAEGLALAYRRYSREYVPQEDLAVAARAGVHAHPCLEPEYYRHGGKSYE